MARLYVHTIDKNRHGYFLQQNRVDPLTREQIKHGDQVVFCAASGCHSVFLLDSWESLEGKKHCNQSKTLNSIPSQPNRNFSSSPNQPSSIKKEKEENGGCCGCIIFIIIAILFFGWFSSPTIIKNQEGSCLDERLNALQIKNLVSGKTAHGTRLSDAARWREHQMPDGTATQKMLGKSTISRGKWKLEGNSICWCYGDCRKYGCKYIEAKNNCSVWYYINVKTGKRTGKIDKWVTP